MAIVYLLKMDSYGLEASEWSVSLGGNERTRPKRQFIRHRSDCCWAKQRQIMPMAAATDARPEAMANGMKWTRAFDQSHLQQERKYFWKTMKLTFGTKRLKC